MAFVEPPPPVEQLPSGTDTIFGANNIIEQALVKIGLAPQPRPGTPSAPPPAPKVNWPEVQAQLAYDWPGYGWPATYNAEVVDALFSDVLGRLGSEAQYNWQVGIALQLELNLLYHYIVVLQTDVSAAAGSGPTVATIPGLTGDLANLQAEIQTVAANAWNNLWSVYNNETVPLVRAAEASAWGNLWALYGNQVVPLVNQAAAIANSNLWALYGNQVVPLVNGEANARVAGDTALGNALTAEQATREQQTNTLLQQVTNETAARQAGDNQIIGEAIPAAIAGLATQVETQLAPIRAEIETCLDPMCDTVAPNAKQLGRLGNLLKGLEGLGIAGLLAGLVAAAIADPQDAADAIVESTGWAVDLSVQLAEAV